MMLGHSIGGYVAAHLAGVMSARGRPRARGRPWSAHGLAAGRWLDGVGASLPEATVADVVAGIGGRLSIAAINGPDNTVVSGPDDEVRAALDALAGAGVEARPLDDVARLPLRR